MKCRIAFGRQSRRKLVLLLTYVTGAWCPDIELRRVGYTTK